MMVETTRIDRLTDILKRLNSGEEPAKVREDAREFLASVDPAELSVAEQKLVEAGLAPEDLRHLCSIHMEVLGDKLAEIKARLCPGHVVHTLIEEHEYILGYLDELERANEAIQAMDAYDAERDEFETLKHVAEHLIHAEPHHEREEEVLFPELEQRGVTGPPTIMRLEHKDLRRRKKELNELAEGVASMDFDEFKRRLDVTAKFIGMTLRDHIWKENNILYPTAVEVIEDEVVWDRLKEEADKIGYCCFTPEV